jgi:hypothetical protein
MKNLKYTLYKYAIPWLHDHFSYAEAVFSSGYMLAYVLLGELSIDTLS